MVRLKKKKQTKMLNYCDNDSGGLKRPPSFRPFNFLILSNCRHFCFKILCNVALQTLSLFIPAPVTLNISLLTLSFRLLLVFPASKLPTIPPSPLPSPPTLRLPQTSKAPFISFREGGGRGRGEGGGAGAESVYCFRGEPLQLNILCKGWGHSK